MNLKMEIENYQKEALAHIPADIITVMGETTQRLVQSGIAERSLRVGDSIPEFSLPDQEGKTVSSRDLLKSGPLVISFLRGGWCPYCNLEIRALQKAMPEIKALGGQLIGILPELPENIQETAKKSSAEFPLLADQGNKAAKQFGLVFSLAEELRPIYKQFGIDIPAHNGDESYELPIPATYVIDKDGVIINCFVDADYTKRMEPADVITALQKSREKTG